MKQKMNNISVSIEGWSAPGMGCGYFVEWFNEATEKVTRWYGSLAECNERAAQPAPKTGWFTPQRARVDQFDLACERRHD